MSLAQGFPNTFVDQVTNQVTKNHENEFKKVYTDVNNLMSVMGHSHTGNGSDGALIRTDLTRVWTTTGRPTGTDLVPNVTGINTDLGYEEYYDGSMWKPKSAPGGYGLGTEAKRLSVPNLNEVVVTGFYFCTDPTNSPVAISGYLLVEQGLASGGCTKQTFTPLDNSGTYIRTQDDETWGAWVNIRDAASLGGYSAVQVLTAYDAAHYIAQNGYQIFSNGLIIQWFKGAVAGIEDAYYANYPIPFPNACLFVNIGTFNVQSIASECKRVFQVRDWNKNYVTYYLASMGINAGNAIPLIFAVGY